MAVYGYAGGGEGMKQELVQAMENMVADMMSDMHTARPGRILEYDPESGVASVEPSTSYLTDDGRKIPFPVISGTPVVMPRGGGCEIVYPVTAGDPCLIIVSECDISQTMEKGGEDIPMKFDLTNAIVIPGLRPGEGSAAARAQDEKAILIRNMDTEILVREDAVEITAQDVNISITGGMVEVTAENATVHCDRTEIAGDLAVTGGMEVSGSVTCSGDVSCSGKLIGTLRGEVEGGGGDEGHPAE